MADKISWLAVQASVGSSLSAEDRRVVAWLVEGKNQVEIARMLGVKRWKVWRQVKTIKEKLPAELKGKAGS